MTNPANWPIVTDADAYFRQNEKRLLHEQRRPVVGHGNIVGPGIAPKASQLDDWNDDVAATNGYFWAWNLTPNGPPPIEAEEDAESYVWLCHSIARDSSDPNEVPTTLGGIQRATTTVGLSEEVAEFPIEVSRRWYFDHQSGTRVYTPWTAGNPQQVAMTVETNVNATATATWRGNPPPDSPFDVPQPSNFLYVPSVYCGVFVTVTLSIDTSLDTAGSYRRVIFWPTFDGSTASPSAASGDFGQWSHYGAGTVGWHEVFTVTRSWWLFPPTAGVLSPGVVIRAPEGSVLVQEIDSYWQVIQ